MPMSDEGRLVADTARKIFSDVGKTTLDAADAGLWPRECWETIEAAGLPRILIPESAGGYGLPLAEGLELIRLAGAAALALPLPESMVANWMLAAAGMAVPEGPSTIATGDGSVTRAGNGWRVSVHARRVPWARHSNSVLLYVADSAACFLVRLRGAAVGITPGANIAGEPRDDIAVEVDVANEDVAPLPLAPQRLQLIGAAMRTLQIAGSLNEVLRMTIEHVSNRQQFGRGLGSFQSIQHQIAILASETAAGNVAADMAADAVSATLDPRAVAAAKARAGDAAGSAASIAHQLHGAMGFTRDARLHTLVRRLWSWRDEFGSEAMWTSALGRVLCKTAPGRLWEALTEI